VGEAGEAEAVAALVAERRPDVVLMDLNLGPGAGGASLTASLQRLPDPPRILVLTTYDTEADLLAAVEAGAVGYLLKDAPPEELFRAVRSTARGETVLAPAVAARLVRRTTALGTVLTEREVAILKLLAEGLTNKEMAKSLFVSEATVKTHLSHIYTKLGVETRAGAVATAIEQRIIRT
jgi:DNA-binding NarL/FixJ family response regulator